VKNARKLKKVLYFLLEKEPLNQHIDSFANVSSEASKLYLEIVEIIRIILLAFSHSRCAVLSPKTLRCTGSVIADFGYDILSKLLLKDDPEIVKLTDEADDGLCSAEKQFRSKIFFCGLITGSINCTHQPLREDLASALIAPVCQEQECAICLENIIEKEGFSVLPGCRHSFCLPCSRKLFNNS
jgi:hypothetical protein